MEAERSISIWFFVGICLVVDGLLILVAGLRELGHAPAHPVVLSSLHANIWWGALLAVVGVIFGLSAAPWRRRSSG